MPLGEKAHYIWHWYATAITHSLSGVLFPFTNIHAAGLIHYNLLSDFLGGMSILLQGQKSELPDLKVNTLLSNGEMSLAKNKKEAMTCSREVPFPEVIYVTSLPHDYDKAERMQSLWKTTENTRLSCKWVLLASREY